VADLRTIERKLAGIHMQKCINKPCNVNLPWVVGTAVVGTARKMRWFSLLKNIKLVYDGSGTATFPEHQNALVPVLVGAVLHNLVFCVVVCWPLLVILTCFYTILSHISLQYVRFCMFNNSKSQCWLFVLRANTGQISVFALKFPYLPSYVRICPRIQLPVSAQWSQRLYTLLSKYQS
jgi:hypothetical protein